MAIIYRHTFTAANATAVTAITPEIGGNLVSTGGPTLEVTNNRARCAVGSGYANNYTPTLGSDPNYIVRGVGRRPAGANGSLQFKLFGRVNNGTGDLYEVVHEPGYLGLRKNVGGYTTLASTNAWDSVVATDYVIELVCNGDQLSVKINGTTLLGPVTDTAITAAGRAGLESAQYTSSQTTEGWHWDTFEVEDFVAVETTTSTTPNTRQGAILANSTGVTRYCYLQNVDGTPATGLTHATSGLAACYVRDGAAATAVTFVSGTANGAWGSGKFAEVNATHCPGLYRVDWPNAAFVSGTSETVTLVVRGTGLRPSEEVVPLALDLTLWGGEVTTGATTTLLPTAGLPTLTAGQLNRRLLQFTGGPCMDERVLIVGQSSGGALQVAPPLTVAPSDGDPFVVL